MVIESDQKTWYSKVVLAFHHGIRFLAFYLGINSMLVSLINSENTSYYWAHRLDYLNGQMRHHNC